eukprot:365685-Chlamydomonas_euryale.AAC.2
MRGPTRRRTGEELLLLFPVVLSAAAASAAAAGAASAAAASAAAGAASAAVAASAAAVPSAVAAAAAAAGFAAAALRVSSRCGTQTLQVPIACSIQPPIGFACATACTCPDTPNLGPPRPEDLHRAYHLHVAAHRQLELHVWRLAGVKAWAAEDVEDGVGGGRVPATGSVCSGGGSSADQCMAVWGGMRPNTGLPLGATRTAVDRRQPYSARSSRFPSPYPLKPYP